MMDPAIEWGLSGTRRHLLQTAGLGIGAMAVQSLLARDGVLPRGADAAVTARPPLLAPRAKHVIYLHMAGSPSQLELYEHKPELQRLHLQDCPESFLKGKRFAFIRGVPKILAGQFSFRQYGESGQWISELLPHFAGVVDRACVIRTMQTEQFNHAPSQLFLHTGSARLGNPSLGSWATWGLGSLNENLPGFVVVCPAPVFQGAQLWASSFLPSAYQGTLVRDLKNPISNLAVAGGVDRQRVRLDALQQLNELHRGAREYNSQLDARIASFELAFQMQRSAPEAFDLTTETAATHSLYSTDKPESELFGRQCLLARRLVESGVRCIEVESTGWDMHRDLWDDLPGKVGELDTALAALLEDLAERGLLGSTLVVLATEFGRSPQVNENAGRDHHPGVFSCVLAGAGVKAGIVHGGSDAGGRTPDGDAVRVAEDRKSTRLNSSHRT